MLNDAVSSLTNILVNFRNEINQNLFPQQIISSGLDRRIDVFVVEMIFPAALS